MRIDGRDGAPRVTMVTNVTSPSAAVGCIQPGSASMIDRFRPKARVYHLDLPMLVG